MNNDKQTPRLYDDLASWRHILSAPEDYAEEAEYFRKIIADRFVLFDENT